MLFEVWAGLACMSQLELQACVYELADFCGWETVGMVAHDS
jgi:hypothetical protein